MTRKKSVTPVVEPAGPRDSDLARNAERQPSLQPMIERLKAAAMRTVHGQRDDVAGQSTADTLDVASEVASMNVQSTLTGCESEMQIQIHEALERDRQGIYGLCVDCFKLIPLDRLDAMPQTPNCITCQRSNEASNGSDSHQNGFVMPLMDMRGSSDGEYVDKRKILEQLK